MHIFYAASDTPHQAELPASRAWHANLYVPLCDLGHTLTELRIDYKPLNDNHDPLNPRHAAFIAKNRPLFGEELLRQVRETHRRKPLDLFFSYFSTVYIEADVIREIKRLGIPTMNWYCNASYQFHLVEDIAPAYDYCLVPEKFRMDDYRRVGANPIYCQEAANPGIYKPYDVPVEFDVTFVGQRYGNRPDVLGKLAKAEIDVRAWGPCWQYTRGPGPWWRRLARRCKNRVLGRVTPDDLPPDHCAGPLSDLELVKMYSRSRISLGFTTVAQSPRPDMPIKQIRLRDFEATMSGAFYLVEHFDELADFFEPDKEIVFYHDAADLIDKCRFYLKHDAERERIRAAGLRRARAEHTWQHRFAKVFASIGLPAGTQKCVG